MAPPHFAPSPGCPFRQEAFRGALTNLIESCAIRTLRRTVRLSGNARPAMWTASALVIRTGNRGL